MDIDLSTLRMIERDKDIPLDYLLTTLEDALLNAYDKTEAPVNGAKVQLDRKTGNVAVMLPEKDEEGQGVGWDDGAVLIVAHGGAISALTCHLLGLDHGQYGILSGLKNTHWSQLTARPDFNPETPVNSLEFTPETVARAQWYFDGWNMGGEVTGDGGADT